MKYLVPFALLLFLLFGAAPAIADDYDDGIGDSDGITTGNNDLSKVTNIKFYSAKAKAKAYNAKKNGSGSGDIVSTGQGGGTNIASPNINGNVYGDVIIQMDARDITVLGQ